MKRMCACLLILALCMSVLPMGVSAKAFELSDLTYTIENGEVTITGCNWKVHGTVELPAVIEGYPVTVIGKNAFMSCLDIKKIVVPEGVHTIEAGGFAHCTQLAELIIPDSILRIGENALNNSYRIKYNEYDNGKYLGNGGNPYHLLAAPKNEKITICVIHPDTKVIGDGAMQNCVSLTSIVIPDQVVTVGGLSFYQCDALTSVVIGEAVREIGNCAFMGCDWLENVTLGSNVTRIGSSAFYGCRLKYNEYALGKYLGNENNPYYALMTNGLYYAENSIAVHPQTRIISESAFYNTHPLVNITISNGVEIIEANAFSSCLQLSEITIPANVTEIRYGAFKGCKNLKDLYFCGDAPSFGDAIFKNVVATAYYHPNTDGWTEETMQDYGGDITWVETHFFKNGLCSVCGESETGDLPVCTVLSGSLQTAGSEAAMIKLYQNGEENPITVLAATDGYRIEALLPGEYVLTASKENHVTRSYPVTLTEEAAVLDLKLQLLGDINGDGKRNVGDVSRIYSHIRKKALIADEYLLSCADLTGDGRVNIGDTADAYAYIKYSN